jgi:predicted metalloprotease
MPPYQQQQYGGPGGGGPFGPGYGGRRPPKKGRGGLIAGIAVGLGLLLIAAVAIPVLRSIGDDPSSDPTAGPTPTRVTPPQPTKPTETAVPTVTTAPPTQATQATQPPAPTKTTTRPRPRPTRTTPPAPTDTQVVRQNKLYVTGLLAASKCAEPGARPTSGKNVFGYYLVSTRCLNKAWRPSIVRARHQFRAPYLVVHGGNAGSTPCGQTSSTGFYCGGNETIYMDATEDMNNWVKFDKVWTRTKMAFTIAHEYGHHVQQLTGIMESSWDRQYAMGSRDLELEESRRRELQASCFSAVYLGADRNFFPVSGNWRRWWRWTVYNHGDQWNPVRDHGDKNNHGWWSMRGYNSRNPGLCNTYTASQRMVS